MDAKTLRIVSISGGKDSTAMYLWAIENFGKDGFLAVFCDTEHEHPVTHNYLRNLAAMADGPEIKWLKADFTERLKAKGLKPSGNAFLDMIRWKGMMPTGGKQFCTSELKLVPTKDWIESIRGDKDVILYLGIRAQESRRRAKLSQSEFSDFYDCLVERPLLNWKIEQVWEILKKHSVPPNPLYAAGMSRVGCFPCINANKSDLAHLPDWAWEKLKDWETKSGLRWFAPGTVPENALATIDEVRAWSKTKRGGFISDPDKQGAVNDVPSCMSTWGVCE